MAGHRGEGEQERREGIARNRQDAGDIGNSQQGQPRQKEGKMFNSRELDLILTALQFPSELRCRLTRSNDLVQDPIKGRGPRAAPRLHMLGHEATS